MSKKVTHATIELETALEFLRRYHPGIWDRVDEDDITNLLEISYSMFKLRPELLAATTNTRYPPTQ